MEEDLKTFKDKVTKMVKDNPQAIKELLFKYVLPTNEQKMDIINKCPEMKELFEMRKTLKQKYGNQRLESLWS